ncbi:hypothetical protein [Dokdonia sp.]|uniref:hypothetical protein n=1 Tax=Dokdonia sp. TaxID=2024995 RepID=UPI00326720B7
MQTVSHKATQFLVFGAKILILAGVFFFIWKRIASDIDIFFENFKSYNISLSSYINIAILLLLSILNWIFEILKWKTLSSHCDLITLKESTKQVLKAHVMSLITPAKIGEYGAKALFFPPHQRKHILFLNLLGNLYQMVATTLFGIIGIGIGIAFLFPTYVGYYFTITTVCIIVLWLLQKMFQKISWKIKGYSWQRIKAFTKTIHTLIKRKAFIYSFVRYFLFAHQFYFLLLLFDVEISYLLGMSLIATMYFVSSLVPMLQLFDVVIKTGVAVALFSWVEVPELTMVTITALMWFFNVALPILPGSYFIMTDTSVSSQKPISS